MEILGAVYDLKYLWKVWKYHVEIIRKYYTGKEVPGNNRILSGAAARTGRFNKKKCNKYTWKNGMADCKTKRHQSAIEKQKVIIVIKIENKIHRRQQ